MSNILEQHIEAVSALEKAKKDELRIRLEIIAGLKEADDAEGTKTHNSMGYVIKAVFKLNRTLDEAQIETLYDQFSDKDKNSLVYKPNLSAKNYKNLDEDSLLRTCITTKSGTPSLKIKPE